VLGHPPWIDDELPVLTRFILLLVALAEIWVQPAVNLSARTMRGTLLITSRANHPDGFGAWAASR
jgi:hypothetical protein